MRENWRDLKVYLEANKSMRFLETENKVNRQTGRFQDGCFQPQTDLQSNWLEKPAAVYLVWNTEGREHRGRTVGAMERVSQRTCWEATWVFQQWRPRPLRLWGLIPIQGSPIQSNGEGKGSPVGLGSGNPWGFCPPGRLSLHYPRWKAITLLHQPGTFTLTCVCGKGHAAKRQASGGVRLVRPAETLRGLHCL